MVWVTIFGATGYAGAVLTKLVSAHPKAQIGALMSNSQDGMNIQAVYPAFNKQIDHVLDKCNTYEGIENADVVFLALPHGKGMHIVAEAERQGKLVIDLSADFRLNDGVVFKQWYELDHAYSELLEKAVYGLPEINREDIANSKLIANPGCYPTSIILGLAPLLKKGLADVNHIIIDSKSGVSGAGKSGGLETSYVEVNENIKAYKIGSHRHLPEIDQELSKLAGKGLNVTFTPHLIPVNRGILSTIYVKPQKKADLNDILALYKEFYQDAPFVRVLDKGKLPQTKWVSGTNYCDIGMEMDSRTGRLVIVSAIDNLIKGAAGQALQNMNLALGYEETAGLQHMGMVP